jgi:hypothetical protein
MRIAFLSYRPLSIFFAGQDIGLAQAFTTLGAAQGVLARLGDCLTVEAVTYKSLIPHVNYF